jgi:hypothetical protein
MAMNKCFITKSATSDISETTYYPDTTTYT